ncbi:MAG: amidophosphoribosyltransferase [Thermonema sp.]|uniref:amidophosphoribosyltransferase n=1 Tax=Thermonema sp. TaxID=2231181 RepID=UPI0021DC9D25|nr:amidophosphoribosyltransferase [Thermonema sp.]GIV39048.1 MAG: amidophosphoribosyltransferase [Thermonema sp.]
MCGIAFVRLRKPYEYYIEKYGTPLYGLNKLYWMMEKQRNRGQDGAGVAVVKLDVPPGYRYISRYRSIDPNPTEKIFKKIHKRIKKALEGYEDYALNAQWLKQYVPFTGEILLGHLRYGTHGVNALENCHPQLRQNNWRSRNLILAGNFNMTNVEELFNKLISLGQHPKEKIDTVTVLEKIGHFLDEENERIYRLYKGQYSKQEMSHIIEENIDLQRVLQRACKDFDGGYAIAGITGYGASFIARDPNGIRPAYFYANDEVIAVASERPAIQQAFGIGYDEIEEIKPAHALIITKDGRFEQKPFIEPQALTACSFERIYFSRGNDPDIYRERKQLGMQLVPKILEKINYNLEDTIFSYVPNSAESAFLGMIEGIERRLSQERIEAVKQQDMERLQKLESQYARVEKLVIKDAKLRTFIVDDHSRNEFVSSAYDTTFGIVRPGVDTLVVMDDSIVRGTTLEQSLLRMLDKHVPKHIIIVSSAPQIRFPDCYGIDMSRFGEFVAFRAVWALLHERNMEDLLEEVYRQCKEAIAQGGVHENYVKRLYEPFSDEEISEKIAEIVRPASMKARLSVVYQSVEGLHKACPNHQGDWYFTGNYPTPGGNMVANRALVNYMEGKLERAY